MLSVVLCGVLCAVLCGARATEQIMRDVTVGFGEALQHCREESQLTEEMLEEFHHFWREELVFEHRELGCAIKCMSHYFQLLTDTHHVHNDNMQKYIESFPDGDIVAEDLMKVLHACEQKYLSEEDECWRILHNAECFKLECQEMGIAPSAGGFLMNELILEADAM